MSDLTKIEQEGDYDVTIENPHFEILDAKNGDSNRMQCVLRGVTDDGQYIDAFLYFTRMIVSGGRNKGKPAWAVAAAKLIEMGMSEPFSPDKIDELEGVRVKYVVKSEIYNEKQVYKVAFINHAGKKKLEAPAANNIWAAFTGKGSPTIPVQSEDGPVDDLGMNEDDNGLPF